MSRAGKGGWSGAACTALALLAMIAPAVPARSAAASARVTVRRVADFPALGSAFAFDVAPDGAALILSEDNILDAGTGAPLFGEPLRHPSWISLAGGKLAFLTNGSLFVLSGTTPKKRVDVPLRSPVLASDGERIFAAGVTPGGRSVLFLIREEAGHRPLLELDAPVDAMEIVGKTLFFSSGPTLFALREGGNAAPVARLPGIPAIVSMAADPGNGVLYFSDGEDLFALCKGRFALVRRGMGGALRHRGGALYLLSWTRRALFRIEGLSAALSDPDSVSPLRDPCGEPDVALFCRAERERAERSARARLAKAYRDAGDPGTAEALLAPDGEEEARRTAEALAKRAEAGVPAMSWGGGRDPKAVGPGAEISGGKEGAGLALWEGSRVLVGPDSAAVLEECAPGKECRLTLVRGVLHFEGGRPAADGTAIPGLSGYTIDAGGLRFSFRDATLVLSAAGDSTVAVVLSGRLAAAAPGGPSAVLAAGEMIEIPKGSEPGPPRPVDLARLNRWWEEIR
ncbi:MAG: hypothetical protein Kow00128_18580 [Deltaproteobacteria bacterium]